MGQWLLSVLRVVGLTLGTTALLAACGGSEQTAEERAKQIEDYVAEYGVDVDVTPTGDGDQQVVFNQNFGGYQGQAGSNLELPTDFSEDVPVFPGSNIYAAANMGMGMTIQAASDAPADTIKAFCSDKMPDNGWAEAEGASAPGTQNLRFTKEKRLTNVIVIDGSGDSPNTFQLSVVNLSN